MRDKIELGAGVFIYADARPPFTVEVFRSGFACVLDSLGRNLVHTAGGATLFAPDGARLVADLAAALVRKGEPS